LTVCLYCFWAAASFPRITNRIHGGSTAVHSRPQKDVAFPFRQRRRLFSVLLEWIKGALEFFTVPTQVPIELNAVEKNEQEMMPRDRYCKEAKSE
jgi:hypothetical protein